MSSTSTASTSTGIEFSISSFDGISPLKNTLNALLPIICVLATSIPPPIIPPATEQVFQD